VPVADIIGVCLFQRNLGQRVHVGGLASGAARSVCSTGGAAHRAWRAQTFPAASESISTCVGKDGTGAARAAYNARGGGAAHRVALGWLGRLRHTHLGGGARVPP